MADKNMVHPIAVISHEPGAKAAKITCCNGDTCVEAEKDVRALAYFLMAGMSILAHMIRDMERT
jgi:hypothetical protein